MKKRFVISIILGFFITFGLTFLNGFSFNNANAARLTESERELMGEIYEIIKDECGNDFTKCIDELNPNSYNSKNPSINNIHHNSAENELELAVKTMNNMGATIFKTADGFLPQRYIRRDEVAKMYVKFAEGSEKIIRKLNSNKKPSYQCQFTDSKYAWSDIRPLLVKSCEYQLFNGYNSKFAPTENLTNGQAVIVLIRMIDKHYSENGNHHYAYNYIQRAKELGLLDGLNIGMSNVDDSVTRGTVAILLYRSLNFI